MKKQSQVDLVLDRVEEFFDGRMSRLNFILDFPYEVQKHHPKMAREGEEFAGLIDDRLVEYGIYKREHLSDEAF